MAIDIKRLIYSMHKRYRLVAPLGGYGMFKYAHPRTRTPPDASPTAPTRQAAGPSTLAEPCKSSRHRAALIARPCSSQSASAAMAQHHPVAPSLLRDTTRDCGRHRPPTIPLARQSSVMKDARSQPSEARLLVVLLPVDPAVHPQATVSERHHSSTVRFEGWCQRLT